MLDYLTFFGHNLITLDFKAVQLRTDESIKGLIYIWFTNLYIEIDFLLKFFFYFIKYNDIY